MNFNKKWLREKVESLSSTITNLDSKREYVGISRNTVLNLIDQIDELKITEEQALNKLAESYPFSADGINAILQAQLAGYSPILTTTFIQPIEPELPVIPQFVADYIEETQRNKRNLRDAFHEIVTRGLDNENAEEWIEDSPDAFARAWLDGYTIEKESVKTRQVLVKFFDNEEYKTELTEDAARELIEFLEAKR